VGWYPNDMRPNSPRKLWIALFPGLLLAGLWLGCATSSHDHDDYDGRYRRDPHYDPHYGSLGHYPAYPSRRGDYEHPLERHQDAEKRVLEREQEREREALRREQKSERRQEKQAEEWDKTDKREQKTERKAQKREQEREDRVLKKHQRNEWEDWYDGRH
jgi:hypothetical protein